MAQIGNNPLLNVEEAYSETEMLVDHTTMKESVSGKFPLSQVQLGTRADTVPPNALLHYNSAAEKRKDSAKTSEVLRESASMTLATSKTSNPFSLAKSFLSTEQAKGDTRRLKFAMPSSPSKFSLEKVTKAKRKSATPTEREQHARRTWATLPKPLGYDVYYN